MTGRDLNIYETGEGGDVILNQNDLSMTDALFSQIYLALFGGNIEENHEDAEEQQSSEERFDYWQNNLFFKDEYEFHLNSQFERALANTALTSQGVFDLENIVLEDLEFLDGYGEKTVNIFVEDVDRLAIEIKFDEPENDSNILVKFVYDASKAEVIEKRII